MIRRWLRLAALIALAPAVGAAQATSFVSLDSSTGIAALDARITARFDREARRAIVKEIARLGALSLIYDPELRGLGDVISVTFAGVTARDAIRQALDGSPVAARVSATGQVVLIAAPRANARVGTIRGVIRSTDTTPIPNARVELTGTRFATYSRDDGTFTIGRVPAGGFSLRVIRVGYRPQTRDVAVDTIGTSVEIALEAVAIPLAEVVVTPAYYGLMRATVAAPVVLDRQQLETIPQIGEDIYRAMSRLPGVAADDISASFAVRGAASDELYVSLDGLQLVEPFHLRDLRNALSILDVRTLDQAELIAGGAPLEFGDHTGGVLRMRSVDARTDGAHFSTGVSLMNARAMAEGGFAGGRGSWLISARRGYLDLAFKILSITDSMKPRYYDAFAKAQYDGGRFGRFAIEGLTSQDRMTLIANGNTLWSHYPSRYVWTRWQSAFGARTSHEAVASLANLNWTRDVLGSEVESRTLSIRDRRSLRRADIRDDWTFALSDQAMLRFGAQLAGERASYDYHGIARATPGVPALQGDTTIVSEAPSATKRSTYLALRARPVRSFTIEGGTRFDVATHTRDRLWSPRLNASWQLAGAATLRGAWGRYAQSQPLFTLEAASGEQQFSPAEIAEQREMSLDLALPRAVAFRAQLYERRMSNERARWINTGPRLDAIPELAIDRALLGASVGRARGLELTLGQQHGERLEWNAGYTLSKVTDDVSGVSIPRASDQRHAVAIDAALHPANNTWRLVAAGIWHSGRPYTPDNVLVDTLVNTPNQFSIRTAYGLGAINSQRTPSYNRIDVRWTRYFDTGHGRVMLFAEVFNLLDTKNSRGSSTAVSVIGRRVSLASEPKEMIGRFPSVGIAWER